jgi:serine/threonine-protein kinase RsbW
VSTNTALAPVRTAVGAGTRNMLLDMAGVTFLSSSGLRALLLVRKELLANGGELRLCELQPQVYEVFTITGFTQVFAIHRTRDDALSAFGQGD